MRCKDCGKEVIYVWDMMNMDEVVIDFSSISDEDIVLLANRNKIIYNKEQHILHSTKCENNDITEK